jgi:hypothetical protein
MLSRVYIHFKKRTGTLSINISYLYEACCTVRETYFCKENVYIKLSVNTYNGGIITNNDAV